MGERWRIGRFELVTASRQLLLDGAPVVLGARAFDLLLALVEARERVCTKDELMARVWPGVVVEENNLTVQISALRKVMGAGTVVTVAGRGYQLGSAAEPASAAASTDAGLGLPQKPSIAVLPFENLSAAGDEYLCDGVSEDIMTELTRFRSLFVISRNTSFAYKGLTADAREVGRELGVRYVLEGSIRRVGERIRVTARLVEAATGVQVWSENYDRVAEDIFAVQEELTRSMVAAIAPQIELSERSRARVRPRDLNAYELALRAWSTLRSPGEGSDEQRRARAKQLAREALALDPLSSFAMRTLAWAAFTELWLEATPAHIQAAEEAVALAVRLIAADNREHYAYHFRGLLQFVLGRHDAGLADLRRALELNPNDASTMSYLGYFQAICGQPEEGRTLACSALQMSPKDPQRYLLLSQAAGASLAGSDYESAIRYATEALADAPWFPGAWVTLAASHSARGELDEARHAVEKLRQLAPVFLEARLQGRWLGGEAYARRGTELLRAAAGLARR